MFDTEIKKLEEIKSKLNLACDQDNKDYRHIANSEIRKQFEDDITAEHFVSQKKEYFKTLKGDLTVLERALTEIAGKRNLKDILAATGSDSDTMSE
ncbi:MAG TPA: hypothetical protein HPQ04_04420 [Rhodospirillaceae bacterium]|nr:hypothetical protein [Rhodospirillaceae bacterium]